MKVCGRVKGAFWVKWLWIAGLMVLLPTQVLAAWKFSEIEAQRGFSHNDIVVAADGQVWIAYGNSELRVAHFNGTEWTHAVVDQSGDVGAHVSIALDRQERPHIAYCDLSNRRLKYASYTNSGWQLEVVDAMDGDDASDVGLWNSLLIDGGNRPHISYHFQGALRYAYFNGQQWITTEVDSNGYAGKYTAIALDSAGHPHISYWAQGDLRHAWQNGAVRTTESPSGRPRRCGQPCTRSRLPSRRSAPPNRQLGRRRHLAGRLVGSPSHTVPTDKPSRAQLRSARLFYCAASRWIISLSNSAFSLGRMAS